MFINKVEDKAFIHTITPLKHKTKSHKIEAKSHKAEKNAKINHYEKKKSSKNNTELILCWLPTSGHGACP